MRKSENNGNKKPRKKNILIISILLLVILAFGGFLLYKNYISKNDIVSLGTEVLNKIEEKPVEKQVQIYKGTDRPIAVMIDNHKEAMPHAGLKDAYMVYEIIVEGGESRLMALFKGQNVENIGPVRSSRHYFLDYALENDAIYVHYGWSPQAEYDIKALKVQNINGIFESTSSFWRVKDKSSPHNVVTSIAKIKEIATKKGYKTTSNATSVLKYSVDEVNLETGAIANNIVIPYSESNSVKYVYDTTTKRYQRYSKGIQEKEWYSKEEVTVKNIIITFAKNTTLNDGENKDRQTLDNVEKLDGYYITDGKAIKITCEKTARSGKTVYKDLNGQEIKVNDGNTFVQICPIDSKVEIAEQ